MKIILTENQINRLIEHNHEINDKPALNFDKLYGTNISMDYNFGMYKENEIWNYWLKCRSGYSCVNFVKCFDILPFSFPYISFNDMSNKDKSKILQGMISGYNPFDIVYFVKNGVSHETNHEQHQLIRELPEGVGKHLKWVLSPETIREIKIKFNL